MQPAFSNQAPTDQFCPRSSPRVYDAQRPCLADRAV